MELKEIRILIYQGYLLVDIAKLFQVHVSTIQRRIDFLNDPTSLFYDKEEYEKLTAKIKENNEEFQEYFRNIQSSFFGKNDVILEAIKNKQITVEQAQRNTRRPTNAILEIVKSEHFKNPHQVLKNILLKYNYFTSEEKKKLINQTTNVQEEIVFVILKYGLTKEQVALLFNTNLKDVLGLYFLFPEYQGALNQVSNQNNQCIKEAKNYYLRRNAIVSNLNKAKKVSDHVKVEVYQEKLMELQRDKYAILLQNRDDLNEEERQTLSTLLKIRNFIYQGFSIKEIAEKLIYSKDRIEKILSLVNHVDTKFYDALEYENMKKQIHKNKRDYYNQIGIGKNTNFLQKTKEDVHNTIQLSIQALAQGKITLLEVMSILHVGFYTLLELIHEYNEKEKNLNLQNILDNYAFAFQYESKNYALSSLEKRRGLVNLALTYRLSIQVLCKLYKTSGSDIEKVFKSINELDNALQYLRYETENETEESAIESFKKGKYFLDRKKLILKNLKKAKENQETEKIEAYQEKWQELQNEISDTLDIEALKSQHVLSDEDKLNIVNYRIKYGLAKKKCAKLFGTSVDTLTPFEEDLMNKNAYYEEKISSLNAYNGERISVLKK